MVLMHLGLIDRPFVPHNLISSQESPVPLPEFQMAPKLNQGPLMESLTERYPTTTVLLHSSIKVPSIHAPHIPGSPQLERGPHGERCPHPENLTYLPGSPMKELPSRPHPRSLFRERERERLHPQSPLHLSLKVPGKWALLYVPQKGAPMERDARLQSLF